MKCPDIDKVMKTLKLELMHPNDWECRKECPYYGKTYCDCDKQMKADAYFLLHKLKTIETSGILFDNDIKKCGSYITVSPNVSKDLIYRKICKDLIKNGVLLMDETWFENEVTYAWNLKGVKQK